MTLNLSFDASARLPALGNVKVSGSYTSNGRGPQAKAPISNGCVMHNMGNLANTTRAAQIAASSAGGLTRVEASRIGLPLGGRR